MFGVYSAKVCAGHFSYPLTWSLSSSQKILKAKEETVAQGGREGLDTNSKRQTVGAQVLGCRFPQGPPPSLEDWGLEVSPTKYSVSRRQLGCGAGHASRKRVLSFRADTGLQRARRLGGASTCPPSVPLLLSRAGVPGTRRGGARKQAAALFAETLAAPRICASVRHSSFCPLSHGSAGPGTNDPVAAAAAAVTAASGW